MALDRYNSQADIFAVPSRAQKVASMLRGWGHKVASLPILSSLSYVFPVGALLTGTAALLESGESFVKGNVVEGTKQLVSGTMDTAATATLSWAGGALFWIANPFSWLITGNSLPENLRQGTQWVMDTLDPGANQPDPRTTYARNNMVLGAAPRTRGLATAGVGFAPGFQREIDPYTSSLAPVGAGYMAPPNYFTNTIAQQRGQDPEQLRANWLRNDENRMSHQELLAAAREQQTTGIGRS